MYPAALLTTLAATLLAAPSVSGQNSTVQCAKGLKMFVSRGTNEAKGLGVTATLVDAIAKQISGSVIEAIEYPATMENPVYFVSVANGTALVKQAITNYAAACPGSKMAVFGYSQVRDSSNVANREGNTQADRVVQGAQISSNALCGTPPAWAVYAVQSSVADVLAFAQPLPANVTKDGKQTHPPPPRLPSMTKPRSTVDGVD
jgi:hypothetical protein